jgi:type II secretory pathway pseudopilin PulG
VGEAPDSFAAMGMMQFGALALVGIPALVEYIDKAKASEAVDETQAILAAALAVRERNGNCSALLGKAGPTPPLEVACHAREGGRCRLGDAGYPATAWTDDPRWAAIGWQPKQGHRFHYAFEASMKGDECTLAVEAFGDLDGDGEFSTYTRSTTIAADGSQRSPGLQIVEEGA